LLSTCLWSRERLLEAFKRLSERYTIDASSFVALKALANRGNALEILVAIVLSQNTSDRNAVRAYERLREALGGSITSRAILSTPREVIEEAIRCAGQQRRRASTIYALAKALPDDGRALLEKLSTLDVEEGRRILMSLPGVGRKTADVFLLMVLDKRTFPVDTHITRVSRRWGLVPPSAGYEDIRLCVLRLMEAEPVESLKRLHLLMIQHGREVCRAREPACSKCFLDDVCARAL